MSYEILAQVGDRIRSGKSDPFAVPGDPLADLRRTNLGFPVPDQSDLSGATGASLEGLSVFTNRNIAEVEPLKSLFPQGILVAAAIWLAYVEYMRRQAGDKWRAIPPNLCPLLAPHYPIINLDGVRFAEGINTIHGSAITIGNEIYFPRCLVLDPPNDLWWLAHELQHCAQYRAAGGVAPFLEKYVLQCVKVLIAKRSFNLHDLNDLELDADAVADLVAKCVELALSKGLGAIGLSATIRQGGFLEVFTVKPDNTLWRQRHISPGGGSSSPEQLDTGVRQVAAATNADGRLEVCTVGTDQALWHQWETSPGGSWSSAEKLDPGVKQVSVAANLDGRLEALTVGTDDALWHMWQISPGGPWSAAEKLDDGVRQVCVVTNADGRLEALTAGTDDALWHQWQASPGGSWSSAEKLEPGVKKINATRRGDGRLIVYTYGADGSVWEQHQTTPSGPAWTPAVKV